jgi:hypothetical protein
MNPSLRPIIVVLCLGQAFVLWWMSGQYRPSRGTGSDATTLDNASPFVWSSEAPAGKFWGNDSRKMIEHTGAGVNGEGKAITIRFDGAGWRGCGLNWKGWHPADARTDVSAFRSLVFHVRQLTNIADADLTIQLVDNVKREDRGPASNVLSVLKDGAVSRIDSEWRRVVLPLDRFARSRDLDLKRLWGIDFSDASGRPLVFQIDMIGFSNDSPAGTKFLPSAGYAAVATVDVSKASHTIRDEIYGVCDMPREPMASYALPIYRWGGNRSSRYNWAANADNAGKDWFFKNGGQRLKNPSDGGWTRFAQSNRAAGATSYLTIPTLGFVSKDQESHAFSIKKYGPQQASESGHPDVGNGIFSSGQRVTNNDWSDTSVEAGPEFIAEGVRMVVRRAGETTRPRYWVLDNEPMLWHDTHRDVRKKPLDYDELWDRTVRYAEAVRQADPTAKIAGFCSWGWTDLFYSAADEGGDGYRSQPDHRSHGGVPLAEWFIKKCGDYKRKNGKSIVDVFDFHWYPQAELGGRGPYLGTGMDVKFNQLRLRTTRDLWDPNYEQESWIRTAVDGKNTMVIRRVRDWVEKHNPGMEMCVGEYNFGGADNISGALAQADVFGILANEKVDLAFIWTHPEGTQELAWKLFRNYNGAGGRFGDQCLVAKSNESDLSVYAAKRSSDGATTIAVINKNLGGSCNLTLNLPGLKGTVKVWRLDQDTGNRIVEVSNESKALDESFTVTVPAASATMFVVK